MKVKDGGELSPYINVRISDMGAEMQQRQFDMVAKAYIGNVEIEHKEYKGKASVLCFHGQR